MRNKKRAMAFFAAAWFAGSVFAGSFHCVRAMEMEETAVSETVRQENISMPQPITVSETEKVEKKAGYVEGEVLVRYKNASGNPSRISKIKSKSLSTMELLSQVSAQENVEYAQPNYIYRLASTDEYYPYQYALDNFGQMGGEADMDISPLWEKKDPKKEVVVAVMDSGVDYTHEELEKRMWRNPYRNNLRGIYGVDTGNHDEDPMDEMAHGTHVAGIIAADTENETGIAGVAGEANVKIMAVKVFDITGMATTESIVEGYSYIYEAVKLGVNVKVINNSFTGDLKDNMTGKMIELLGKKGVLTVASTGNEGLNLDSAEAYPAREGSPYVISVAASDQKGRLASYSNYGAQTVDLAAPGSNILSAVPYGDAAFEPSLYTDEQKKAYCKEFQDFSKAGNINWTVSSVQGTKGSATAVRSREESFGYKDLYSLEWKIKDAKKKEYYMLMFPYVSDGEEQIYQSAKIMIKSTADYSQAKTCLSLYHVFLNPDDTINYSRRIQKLGSLPVGKNEDCWETLTVPVQPEAAKGERCAFIYQLEMEENSKVTIYMDDYAVSQGALPKKAFLPYQFYNGTSMSAPHVSGAVAVLAAREPQKNALELKKSLLSCVRCTPSLKGKVKTGGTLNFQWLGQRPFIDEVSLKKDGSLVILGGGFSKKNQTLWIDDKEVEPEYISASKLVVKNAEKYSGRQIELVLRNDKEESTRRIQYVTMGKKPAVSQRLETEYLAGVTDIIGAGKYFYTLSSEGILAKCDAGGVKESTAFGDAGNFKKNPEYHISNCQLVPYSNMAYAEGKIYVVLDAVTQYTDDLFLASYDIKKRCFQKEKNLPYEYRTMELSGYTLASYEGNLYFLGGVDEKVGLSSGVICYQTDKREFKDMQELPEKLANVSAAECNGKLYVVSGCVEKTPKLFSYDGKKWKIEKELEKVLDCMQPEEFLCSDGTVKHYRYDSFSMSTDGARLLFAGGILNGYGDLFYYAPKKKQFVQSAYSMKGNSLVPGELRMAYAGGKAYILESGYQEDAKDVRYPRYVLKERIYQLEISMKKGNHGN